MLFPVFGKRGAQNFQSLEKFVPAASSREPDPSGRFPELGTKQMTDQQKTILFLETGTQGGGSFVSLYQYLAAMDRTRYRPVVCFLNRTLFVEKIEALDIPVHLLRDPLYAPVRSPVRLCLRVVQRGIEILLPALRPLFDRMVHWKTVRALTRLLHDEQADLLVLNVQIDRDNFALAAAQAQQVPVVSHLRSNYGKGFTPAAARHANQQVAAFIANSASTRSWWGGKGLDPGQVAVVHNAVPARAAGAADLEAEFGIPCGTPVVCCIGRLIEIKGQDVLIKATAELSGEFPSLRLLLVGDGKEQKRLEQLARDCGMRERTVFAGWRQDALDLAAASSVLAVPSREEAFGRSVIEGMLAGIPVVAARTGGIPEILTDGVDGLLVEPDDSNALANALRRIFADSGLADRLIDAARQTAETKFGVPVYVKRVEAVYRRALERD